MISDLIYTSTGFYISNQVRSMSTYSPSDLAAIGLYTKRLFLF